LNLARVRNPKATSFLSYVEFRPYINASNIIYIAKYKKNLYTELQQLEYTKLRGNKEKDQE
jgi:hypothetical protein